MKKSKEHIIDIAIILLEKNIFASLDEIALESGISRRTLHRYFDGKEELIIQVFETLLNEYTEGFIDIIWAEMNTVDTIKSLLKYDLKWYSRYTTIYNLYETHSDKYKFEEDLIKKIEQDYISIFTTFLSEYDCNPLLNSQWLEAYYTSILKLGGNQIKTGLDKETVFKTIWEIFWNGIISKN
ncbi:TetR/AcrR family transcriptional regulator [Olleya sp.]|jgi:AcrR family transcriptional regulator|uniref:TetR/AcrR family transcriptional regulator n=1 Tax=Olleya sp. TaxID=1906788 RepID=UPI0032D8C5C3